MLWKKTALVNGSITTSFRDAEVLVVKVRKNWSSQVKGTCATVLLAKMAINAHVNAIMRVRLTGGDRIGFGCIVWIDWQLPLMGNHNKQIIGGMGTNLSIISQ